MSGFAYRVADGKAERIDIQNALETPSDLVWVHLTSNNEQAKAWLGDVAKLPDYVVEALTTSESRPRCEALDDGAILNLRGRSNEAMTTSDPLASLRIWATAGRVISVTRRSLTAVDDVTKQIEGGTIRDPGDLIAEFAVAITEELDLEVADLGDSLDDCEADLDADKVFVLRRNVTKVRVAAIGYRRFLTPQRAALEKLASLPCDWLQDDDRLHLASAADRAARMAEELESIRERSALMHEALTDLRAEQIDSRSLLISIVALIFLPLTFLTGLYGMNVEGLPFAKEPWAFDVIGGICIAITVGIIGYFSVKRWFG
ncbi:zinc transporter ZntB [Sphingomonas sp. 10B4]|uniref:zinc transporter ZntB n=1 Tax=Sphingomonas sp. 10B4 TaxID=3048575 RepID=UPI002AB580E4|nr:zinc transporter ZntB [Sphingomonas sp. 10B4]MDY7523948.1 zinc transporter ZntB [Sphingomonas sp. 10B4]MEB0282536.1 zinc transporter ZntB [Sphingomonas sp. 10B4]